MDEAAAYEHQPLLHSTRLDEDILDVGERHVEDRLILDIWGQLRRQHESPAALLGAFSEHLPAHEEDGFMMQVFAESLGEARENPMREEEIAALPRMKVCEPSQCCVCQDGIHVGSEATQLPCGHTYHPDCIAPWLRRQHTCPTCRADAVPQPWSGSCDGTGDGSGNASGHVVPQLLEEEAVGVTEVDTNEENCNKEDETPQPSRTTENLDERSRLDALFPELRELDALRRDVLAEQQAVDAADATVSMMQTHADGLASLRLGFQGTLSLGGVAREDKPGETCLVAETDPHEEPSMEEETVEATERGGGDEEAETPTGDVADEVAELRRENKRMQEENARLAARLATMERRLLGDDESVMAPSDPVKTQGGKAKIQTRPDACALLPAALGILSQLQVGVLSHAKAEANSILADPLCL